MPSQQNPLGKYLTFNQLAKELRKHPRTIKRWADQPNGLPFARRGRDPITTYEWYDEWLLSGRKVPNPDRRSKRRR